MSHIPADVWAKIKPLFLTLEREVAVVVWKDGTFDELANLHPEPANNITFTDADKRRLTNNPDVLALLHSHPSGNPEPSDTDSQGQMAMGVPWGVIALKSAPLSSTGANAGTLVCMGASYPECWGDGVAIPPLLGRSYLWQVRDCFSLVRDYYRLQGHHMPQAMRSRQPGLYPLSDPRSRPMTNWAPLVGLQPINTRDRQPGDTVVCHMPNYGDPLAVNWPRNEPNHCMIYLGEGKYLHQLRDAVSDYWTPKNEEQVLTGLKAQFLRLKVKNARTRRSV